MSEKWSTESWTCTKCGAEVAHDELRTRLVEGCYAVYCGECIGALPEAYAPKCAPETAE